MVKIGTKFGNGENGNIGLNDYSYLDEYPLFDFVELYVLPGINYTGLEKYNLPVVIHCPHYGDNINFADSSLEEQNNIALQNAIRVADQYQSSKIIFHPERILNNNCSRKVLENFIKNNYDNRLLIENMPSGNGFFGQEAKDLKNMMEEMNVGLCLDFDHAATYAFEKGVNFKDYLRSLMDLGPSHFHVSDTLYILNSKGECEDQHLTIGDGDIDYEYIKSIIAPGSWITLETPKAGDSQIKELDFLKVP